MIVIVIVILITIIPNSLLSQSLSFLLLPLHSTCPHGKSRGGLVAVDCSRLTGQLYSDSDSNSDSDKYVIRFRVILVIFTIVIVII